MGMHTSYVHAYSWSHMHIMYTALEPLYVRTYLYTYVYECIYCICCVYHVCPNICRYLDALREQIKERMKSRGIDPPPLCACHADMWDSGPLTCANNCMFYRNPDTYARTLASLLSSMDVLWWLICAVHCIHMASLHKQCIEYMCIQCV